MPPTPTAQAGSSADGILKTATNLAGASSAMPGVIGRFARYR
jgi:hypothetical protein